MKLENVKPQLPVPGEAGDLPKFSFQSRIIDSSDNEYWNYCDNCGTRLQTFRCRYVCPKCGFFHSCSEP